MELDHLAVAGETLEAAAAHVEDALGVRLETGGKHEKFGTYNKLLGLEDGLYLEAIAVDPNAAQPKRTRWFDLDRFQGAPRLTNWICRVKDIEAATVPGGPFDPTDLERGALRWRMIVPSSGRLPYDNLYPALIQWQGDLHPAGMLQAGGCRLLKLLVSHPEATKLAQSTGPVKGVEFQQGPPGLRAEFETPNGRRVLE
nr:VOC family protein [uncultured Ruegeria sp.]